MNLGIQIETFIFEVSPRHYRLFVKLLEIPWTYLTQLPALYADCYAYFCWLEQYIETLKISLAIELNINTSACYGHIKLLDNILCFFDLEFAFKVIYPP